MPVAKWFAPKARTPGSFSKLTLPISWFSKLTSIIEISVKLLRIATLDPYSDVSIGIEVKNPSKYPLLVAATSNYPFLKK